MTTDRILYRARLQPILGSTFQPTGFPDIGAATFERWEGDEVVDALLVESVQSMANRLEGTAWDDATRRPVDAVSGLPWVQVERDGEFLTSSRLEAHRLASAWIRDSTLDGEGVEAVIGERLGLAPDTPLDYPKMAAAVARLDPFCLLHGVFFSQKSWLGQPKFPRAISAVVEATDVRRAVSGGRKADHVRHNLSDAEAGGSSEGYGSVPFHRIEWTAREIVASFVIDSELIRSYGLPGNATEALLTLAQWEVRRLLSGGLRLRTACDLEVVDITGDDLPELDPLTNQLRQAIDAASETFAPGDAIVVEARAAKGKKAS